MVKPLLVSYTLAASRRKKTCRPLSGLSGWGPLIPLSHSLGTIPDVCGMIWPIGNLPGRMQRRCEAAVAAIQTCGRMAAGVQKMLPEITPLQRAGRVRAVALCAPYRG
jgi:hypothetical protein